MKEAAAEQGIDWHIEFCRRLRSASWPSEKHRWTLTVDDQSAAEGERPLLYSARFILLCTGYFDFHQPIETVIAGLEYLQGQVVHPQFRPEDLDYAGKNIVVVGSGATAITLLPALSEKAARVTMLQRSPSYIVEIPRNRSGRDSWLSRFLPSWILHPWRRLTSMLRSRYTFLSCQAHPEKARERLIGMLDGKMPPHLPVDPHFTPSYFPYDQCVTLTPDGGFFKCLLSGKGDVKTGLVKQVVTDGILVQATTKEGDGDNEDLFL